MENSVDAIQHLRSGLLSFSKATDSRLDEFRSSGFPGFFGGWSHGWQVSMMPVAMGTVGTLNNGRFGILKVNFSCIFLRGQRLISQGFFWVATC